MATEVQQQWQKFKDGLEFVLDSDAEELMNRAFIAGHASATSAVAQAAVDSINRLPGKGAAQMTFLSMQLQRIGDYDE